MFTLLKELIHPNKPVVESTITGDNIQDARLSAIFIKVIGDVRYAQKRGLDINMDKFGEIDNGKLCAVCLGGAAALGLMTPKQIKLLPKKAEFDEGETCSTRAFADIIDNGNEEKIVSMMKMFDSFRNGSISHVFEYYNEFATNKIDNMARLWREYHQICKENESVTGFDGYINKIGVEELILSLINFTAFLISKNL